MMFAPVCRSKKLDPNAFMRKHLPFASKPRLGNAWQNIRLRRLQAHPYYQECIDRWVRLITAGLLNVGIVLVFAAFYLRFLNNP
ncbi:hypothetical protein LMG28614_03633 [Paraburkholderia ultramafica]|uniref:Uncharacterized protein n=1 Tax=Paraburkholderia ultramafica TaxID=1544867 RepID=A0A6S7B9V4_9BURK|nr:hypothetical protein LMG28614_03633 [Paraburkholderia ultramafica]